MYRSIEYLAYLFTQVRTAYGRIAVRPDGMCEVDLFVQEVDGLRIQDP